MKTSLYSTAWNVHKYNFDFIGALDNWVQYADEIVIAVNNCQASKALIEKYALSKSYPIKIVDTNFSTDDPFMYGKILNSALQQCSGDLMIQQDLDERIRVNRDFLSNYLFFLKRAGMKSLFLPTIDLYGSYEQYVKVGRKWYIHLPGLFRGPVSFGIKSNGKPDYNKTSTDELIDENGNLVPFINAYDGNLEDIDSLRSYVNDGLFLSYHLGYVNLNERAEKAVWWKEFWEKATGGDKNSHITDVQELLKRETKFHKLPLWT